MVRQDVESSERFLALRAGRLLDLLAKLNKSRASLVADGRQFVESWNAVKGAEDVRPLGGYLFGTTHNGLINLRRKGECPRRKNRQITAMLTQLMYQRADPRDQLLELSASVFVRESIHNVFDLNDSPRKNLGKT